MRITAFALVTLLATPCFAQQQDRVVYKPKTIVDFTQIAVTGEVTRPTVVYVETRQRAKFRSLVRARGSFLGELERSVEAL